ncbi:MAG TPA: hypothetical protein VFQ53_26545 [Kofleriaceae bacterium]|nr:hypothetical protein [Kofleriaceae bacterium]
MNYDELATLAFDQPYDDELRQALLVCADRLGQDGDPRGALITMEHAVLAADGAQRRALERGIEAHVLEHGAALLGAMAQMMTFKHSLKLAWRAGQIYGALLDTRHLAKQGMTAPELVKLLLKIPAAVQLRRLRVRVSSIERGVEVVTALGKRKHPPPLEHLEVGPRACAERVGRRDAEAHRLPTLLDKYPYLHFCTLFDVAIALPIRPSGKPLGDPYADPEPGVVSAVTMADPPTTLPARALLGRALTHADPIVRAAGLQRITELGPAAACFAPVLLALLRPGLVEPQLPIVHALRAIGARDAIEPLAVVSSRVDHYDVATRRAAGAAAWALRQRSA